METDKKVAVSAEAPEPSQMALDATETNGTRKKDTKAPAKAAEAPSEVTERSRSARTEQSRTPRPERTRPEQRRSPRPDRPEQNREPRHENPEQLSKKLGSLATKSYEELLTLARELSDKGELPPLVNIPAKYRTEPSTPVTEPPVRSLSEVEALSTPAADQTSSWPSSHTTPPNQN